LVEGFEGDNFAGFDGALLISDLLPLLEHAELAA
jgi:hypothetical protein